MEPKSTTSSVSLILPLFHRTVFVETTHSEVRHELLDMRVLRVNVLGNDSNLLHSVLQNDAPAKTWKLRNGTSSSKSELHTYLP